MEIKWYDLDEDKPYYEVEVWIHGGRGFECYYFSTLAEARKCLKARHRYLKSIDIEPNQMDCIKRHGGYREGWSCEIVK